MLNTTGQTQKQGGGNNAEKGMEFNQCYLAVFLRFSNYFVLLLSTKARRESSKVTI